MLPSPFAIQDPSLAQAPVPLWLDLAAVVVGSLSGALCARERRLDLVGYMSLAIVCGLGGGLVRDTIMQKGSVYMLESRWAIVVSLATGVLAFLFPSSVAAHPRLLEWTDIVSVGLFAAAGTDKAVLFGLSPVATILMGTITGVGGGMLRDVFLGEVPHIFRRSNWYALCAIAGSAAYCLLVGALSLDKAWGTVACVALTLALRRLSLRYGLYSPADVDLAPAVRRVGRSVLESAQQAGQSEGERLVERQRQRNGRG